jgi:surfactin synthase thioesterase subunit
VTAWLQRRPSASSAARVFCIPHAGCGTGVFRNWPPERNGVEFLPMELPGRLTRFAERMPGTFQELADCMIASLRPYLDVPFAFFGHCWSAAVAYEVSGQLHRVGAPRPARLFVSSSVPPQDGPAGRMLLMNEAELATELEAMIRDQGNRPHPELVSIYVKVLQADIETYRRYLVARPVRLACPILAIGWRDDTEVRPEQMAGWTACGDTTFTVFPGRHHGFIAAPSELLDALSAGW